MAARSAEAAAESTPASDTLPSASAVTFSNPVLWEDYPDLDVFRIGDVFYYSSSTFAFSPGAPVLKSYDLINWEPVSHSVPELNFGAAYNLDGHGQGYVKGIWASSLRYRESNDMFYWIGCVDSGKTYIWTAPGMGAAQHGGEVANWTWTSHTPINTCYYDCGLLVDDDDTMYVAYGNTNIYVAQLSSDGLRQVSSQKVYTSTGGTIEGSRMYKINGTYYIFVTKPADSEWVLKSSSPFGPYQMQTLVTRISGPLQNAGYSHQGGVVNTQDNKWYYVAFMDSYPGGRIPVVAPLTWTASGWPQVVTDAAGGWGKSYPMPVQTSKTIVSPFGIDEFRGDSLSHEWEWNHNPDKSKWRLAGDGNGGLILGTADVTKDLFAARNTITHRIMGPKSTGTFRLDISKMKDGDRAGAVLFRDRAAYIGVWQDKGTAQLVMVSGLNLTVGTWNTSASGTVAATGPTLPKGTAELWLQIQADITPSFGSSVERTTTFSYSTDGKTFTRLGPAFSMSNDWRFFTGYRFGAFNHATKELGGEVKVKSFAMQLVN
ncbi:Arabinanase/levansucrase/invertase [Thozetella sp. PMI_491]|nr:Arabinanase/levansucrase/invertase [Thozetella sp. PMI_491]